MFSIPSQEQLRQLRLGDRLKYHNVQWQVKAYSTYVDPKGYETTEWLLRSPGGSKYYLLREFDPQNSQRLVNWYLAEEITDPMLLDPKSFHNLAVNLWNDMQGQKTPYPELQALNRNYYFESQTQGTYEGTEQDTSRITWDYWDKAHQWNLALEAWPEGELHVYSTKVVQPQEFSEIEKAGVITFLSSFPIWELMGACCFIIVGLWMLIFG